MYSILTRVSQIPTKINPVFKILIFKMSFPDLILLSLCYDLRNMLRYRRKKVVVFVA